MTRPDITLPTPNDRLETSFLENYRALLRFIRSRGTGEAAEDIVQELWLKARWTDARLQTKPLLDDPRAFLYRMAINLVADHYRTRLRRQRRDGLWVECTGPVAIGSFEASAETTLIVREQLSAVESWLTTMGAQASAIFKRYRIEGASHAEIARERGITVSGVEKHLCRCYRALEHLRRDLAV